MIRLRTLGALDLRSEDGTEVHSVLRQPKRLALLAFLALARPRGFHRRDRLVALFWPELDRDRARHALSQAVFYLRRSLGPGLVVNRGDEEVGLGPAALWCDAVAFEDALEAGHVEEALSHYRGELLSGFYIDDAADFERWLDEERRQLAQRAAEAAWSLADQAGTLAATTEWAARGVALAPWDERGLRRLMTLLDAAGDRAGAIAAYQDFARRLHTDLETEPSAETQALMEAIKARVEPNGGQPAPLPAADPEPAIVRPPEPTGVPTQGTVAADGAGGTRNAAASRPSAPHGVAALVSRLTGRVRWTTALLLLVGLSLIPFLITRSEAMMRVAVLPVRDESPNGQYSHITDALTGTLIQLMHHPGSLHVVSEFGVRRFKHTTPTREEIARQLDVGYIVSSVLTGSAERIKVTIELIDATTGAMIDRRIVQKSEADWLAFTEQVGAEVATLLRTRLGVVSLEGEWSAGTLSTEAWETVQSGAELRHNAMDLESEGDLEGALRIIAQADSLFRLASDRDEGWSEPFAMLARTTVRRAFMSLFDTTATDAHRSALLDTAEGYANQALARDRENAAMWELRGTVKHRRSLLVPPVHGAADSLIGSAEADLRKALAIEPLRSRAASTLSYLLMVEGRLGEALDAGELAYANDAYLTEMDNIVFHLFQLSFHLKDDVGAGRWCGEVERRMPDTYGVALCSLMLFSWGEDAPTSARPSLLLLETYGRAESEQLRDAVYPMMAALAAPAVAREHGADSARVLLAHAHARAPAGGPFLEGFMEFEAAALVAIGDDKGARAAVRRLLVELPTARKRVRTSRFFEPLFKDGSEWLDREPHGGGSHGSQVQMRIPLTQ